MCFMYIIAQTHPKASCMWYVNVVCECGLLMWYVCVCVFEDIKLSFHKHGVVFFLQKNLKSIKCMCMCIESIAS